MKTRTKQLIFALLAVQGLAFGGYRLVQRSRAAARPGFAAERLSGDERAADLEVQRPDGTRGRLLAGGRPTLVHFWASWCHPCVEELPGLVAFAARERATVDVVAVSVDDGWPEVRAFFGGGEIPAVVVQASGASYGGTLPDSYLVGADGRLLERYAGARDWRSPAAAAHLRAALRPRSAR